MTGELVRIGDESFYRINGLDELEPFLMSIVSSSDHWLFASSTGALTAGRRDVDHALFPYDTDDVIHDSRGRTGGTTILRTPATVWEPFAGAYTDPRRSRALLKSVRGTTVSYQETRHDLGLTFSQSWTTGDTYGFLRRCTLTNHGTAPVTLDVLDGLRNLVPAGTDHLGRLRFGTLVDGLTDAELDRSGVGLYRLSALRSDHAEPAESLRATTVLTVGLDVRDRLLCTVQVDAFRRGAPVTTEHRIRGRRAAYLVTAHCTVPPGATRSWSVLADVAADAAAVVALRTAVLAGTDLAAAAVADAAASAARLDAIVAAADGLQCTADAKQNARHRADTTFNVLRGGLPDDDHRIGTDTLAGYLGRANAAVRDRHAGWLAALPAVVERADLLQRAERRADPHLTRRIRQYLPLRHSRRHGDPSRPWNDFTIRRDALGFEGNWRDIFQNWEALGHAYPGWLDAMMSTFVNASTADGFNPFHLDQDGFDWETAEPGSAHHLGYWGDHQVVYLLRLLLAADRFHPGLVAARLGVREYVYADVPYRIRPYANLLADPHRTVDFDAAHDRRVRDRIARTGTDGALLPAADGTPLRVTLGEKLLLVALARLTHYVPGLGIWLNTQRPEWNDGNNALVGYGVSVVTLAHLRRYLTHCRDLFAADTPVELTVPLAGLFRRVVAALTDHEKQLTEPIGDTGRRTLLDLLGTAGGEHRAEVYAHGPGERRTTVPAADVRAFCDVAVRHLDHALRANRRPDGLYHSYNLIRFLPGAVQARHLYPMLEGQVAVLGAGLLTPAESAEVLDALRASPLYRPDQESYLLYPDRELPGLLATGVLPPDVPAALLRRLLDEGLAVADADGTVRFAAAHRNARDLAAALSHDPQPVLDLYERVYDHQSFTGRSGTLFKYEGLGCIYWHQVSKLRLAVAELLATPGAEPAVRARLRAHYEAIRAGLGVHKSPAVHGAVPTDPYSHTPGFTGAQQPGMTGQVKEDILCRLGELGVTVSAGRLEFRPDLLRTGELLTAPAELPGTGIVLPAGSVGLTVARVPVVVHAGGPARIEVGTADGTTTVAGLRLDAATSAQVFARTGRVHRLDAYLAVR